MLDEEEAVSGVQPSAGLKASRLGAVDAATVLEGRRRTQTTWGRPIARDARNDVVVDGVADAVEEDGGDEVEDEVDGDEDATT